jgi:hypothetical protein
VNPPRNGVAFVLGGGGRLGAHEVGMLEALFDRGVTPTLIVGTSVGAINGAVAASSPAPATVERLAEVWSRLEENAVFNGSIVSRLATLARTRTHLHANDALRDMLAEALPERIEDLEVPFQCIAASIERASEHWFASGPLGSCRGAAVQTREPRERARGFRLAAGGGGRRARRRSPSRCGPRGSRELVAGGVPQRTVPSALALASRRPSGREGDASQRAGVALEGGGELVAGGVPPLHRATVASVGFAAKTSYATLSAYHLAGRRGRPRCVTSLRWRTARPTWPP